MIIEELGLPHEVVPLPLSDVKKPEYLEINPNGRVPTMHDPNTGIQIFESGAIVEYLCETYDKQHKLSFAKDTPEYWLAKQWLFFQVSGQGPYYGQAAWFLRYHPEDVPSAKKRYIDEIHRVTGVLEGHLAKQKDSGSGSGPWLVGGKMSYADIAFVPYQMILPGMILSKDQMDADKYPMVKDWLHRMSESPGIGKVIAGFGKGH